ncbi:MAG TPA: polysaccharide biosynthesis tyrosine autokinase [Pyrinomonadaceae bacterium]|nr:polysaccharide biosynthesis tyrosine autokinase [Pyrinomonadaceae bacterium]
MDKDTQLVRASVEPREMEIHANGNGGGLPYGSYGYGAAESQDGHGFSRLQAYWQSVRKHLLLIIGIVLLVTMIAAIYMARQSDIYEARSRVQVDLEISNPGVGAIKSNSYIIEQQFQDPTYFNTQIQILSSPGLLSRIVKTLDLEHNQSFLHPQGAQSRSTWENLKRMVGAGGKSNDNQQAPATSVPLTDSSLAPATASDDIAEVNRLAPFVEMLQGRLSVKSINDTRLIEVRFTHPDPQLAAKIVNAVTDAFVLQNLEHKTQNTTSAGDFLQHRIAELQTEMRTDEERLINYAKSHQILSLDASQNTVVDRLAGLNRQLLEAENDRKMAEAAWRAAQAPGAAEALARENRRNEAEAQIVELRRKRAELLVDNTEEWPEVQQINKQIAELENQIRQARAEDTSTLRTNLETHYRQALQREEALRQSFEQQRGETLTQNEAAVNYRIIQQGIETNKQLLDGLLQRAKEVDMAMAGTPNNIHVLDYAPTPKSPVGPKRLQGIMLGMLFSLVLGIALARYLDYLDDAVHTSEDVEKTLRLPTLAIIPAVGSLTRRRLLPSIAAFQKRGAMENRELLLKSDARSPLAEAYRQLRTSVLLSAAGGAPQTLLVTSGQPSEGKTTTALNTALIMAQTEANVLIIDADMRRPRLHSLLGLENGNGLSTILSSNMSEADMLNIVEHHGESGLYVLPSGAIPPNPAELLGSNQMQRLMEALKRTFTHIIIDSPPIASFTDGVLLSTKADGVLLVVHGGRASRAIVRRSRQILQDVGAKIFGVVLNNVTLSRHDYYYRYYQQSYYDKYGQAEAEEFASTATGTDA